MRKSNIILIGMPGAGKSTAGVLAAKSLGMGFIDTDLLIQERAGLLLCEILAERGRAGFLRLEEEVISRLADSAAEEPGGADPAAAGSRGIVIATGGSAVLSPAAMERLRGAGVVIYLRVPLGELRARIGNITTRGIVMEAGEGLDDIFTEREPLYEKYADAAVDASGGTEDSVRGIVEVYRGFPHVQREAERGIAWGES